MWTATASKGVLWSACASIVSNLPGKASDFPRSLCKVQLPSVARSRVCFAVENARDMLFFRRRCRLTDKNQNPQAVRWAAVSFSRVGGFFGGVFRRMQVVVFLGRRGLNQPRKVCDTSSLSGGGRYRNRVAPDASVAFSSRWTPAANCMIVGSCSAETVNHETVKTPR